MIYDDCDGDWLEAEIIFNKVTDENGDEMEKSCAKKSKNTTEDFIGGVLYKTYEMFDRSKITFGNNGYVGFSTE